MCRLFAITSQDPLTPMVALEALKDAGIPVLAHDLGGPKGRKLIFETHTRLTPIGAVEMCNAIADCRPYFVEDPIRSESPQAFHLLREKIDVPLAVGEQFCSKWELPATRVLIAGARIFLMHSLIISS